MSLNIAMYSASLQKGSALVIAVFISVVMLLLVVALSKLLVASSEGVSYEVQGTRSFFAAQSGLEFALTELFPLAADTPASSCPGTLQSGETVDLATSTISFATAGLQNCSAHVACQERLNTSGAVTHFWLTSTGLCGDPASVQSSRTIEMEVWQ